MTVDGNIVMKGPIINENQTMELTPSGALPDLPQLAFPMDHQLSPDLSMYASSPNSLFMYEQERNDMQNSFNPRCSTGSRYRSSMSESSDTVMEGMDMEYVQMPDFLSSSCNSCDTNTSLEGTSQPETMWESNNFNSPVNVKVEDVFQSDTVANKGPTLAALNCDESIFDDIESVIRDDLATSDLSALESALPAVKCVDVKPKIIHPVSAKPQTFFSSTLLSNQLPPQAIAISSSYTSTAPLPNDQESSLNSKVSLQRLLIQKAISESPSTSALGSQSPKPSSSMTLSSNSTISLRRSLPVDDQKWAEVQRFLHEDEVVQAKGVKAESTATGAQSRCRHDSNASSTMSHKSHIKEELDSHDEGFGSDHEESSDHDWMSESDTDDSYDHLYTPNSSHPDRHKEPQYFWQYNAQSKGPKQSRLCIPVSSVDPHVLHNFEDPVFDPGHRDTAIRHGGKARRGDGNDIQPNPKKLYQIGSELRKLSQVISDLSPSGNVPVSVRNKSKREKNKLASRACRLKKKAQHEANKVKLFGLEQEHSQLMLVLQGIKQELATHVKSPDTPGTGKLSEKLDQLYKENLRSMIAGHAADYVNMVVEAVKGGDPAGGLDLE